jgi:hypothetical protein
MSLKLNFFNATVYNCKDISSNPIFKGNNKKGILILCNHSENAEINDFLKKIMGAVNCELGEDTAMLEIKDATGLNWSDILRKSNSKSIILFGIDPIEMGLHLKIAPYQLLNWNDLKILYADKLESILSDKNKKALLWRELQLMFGKN